MRTKNKLRKSGQRSAVMTFTTMGSAPAASAVGRAVREYARTSSPFVWRGEHLVAQRRGCVSRHTGGES
jgi:hypothetical protein